MILLRKNRAEAVKMSIYEFDEEKEWALMREAEYNVGVEAGIEVGMERVASRMLAAGTYTLEEVINISGLSEEKVMELKNARK
ncbi:MAG: hypothetical protein NC118_00915 [Eubacterium sp.]|nr:hypothetical protein [Eubacterium sp.]